MSESRVASIRAFIFFIALELLIAAIAIAFNGFSLEALHIITRFSGRLSLVFFSLFLIAREKSSLHKWISNYPFTLFAIIHGIHLVELSLYVQLSGNKIIPVRVAGGFLAYLMIFIMPFLKTKVVNRKVMARLEQVYFVYVWFIFFMSYLPRVLGALPNVGGSYPEFVVLFVWVNALGIYKLLSFKKLIPVRNHNL